MDARQHGDHTLGRGLGLAGRSCPRRYSRNSAALAAYESIALLPAPLGQGRDLDLPITYQRLGELYETKGDKAKALEYYGQFVDLWKDADPELQPRVAAIRKRIGQLAGEPGAR